MKIPKHGEEISPWKNPRIQNLCKINSRAKNTTKKKNWSLKIPKINPREIHPKKILEPKIRSKENPETENSKNSKKILPGKILEPKILQNQIRRTKNPTKKSESPKMPGKFHLKES